MTRDEMIDVLIEDRITDWVYAQNTDGLEEMLFCCNWKAYDNYTDDELKEALEFLDEDQIKYYLKESKKRKIEQRKRWEEDEKKAVENVSKMP